MTRCLIWLFAAATMLLAGACSPKATISSPDAAGPAIPAQLQFTAETLDGHQFSGDSLFGKPATLWFWAPWCPACMAEAASVRRVAEANPAVTFVGVGARDKLPALQKFVDKYRLGGFTQLADTDAAVWSKFGVTRQPAYAFVGADGAIDVVKGTLAEYDLSKRVQALAGR